MNIISSTCAVLLLGASLVLAIDGSNTSIDWNRARELRQRQQQGEPLTVADQAYLAQVNQAIRERATGQQTGAPAPQDQPPWKQRGGNAPPQNAGITAPSHVFTRGDVEILTFETEQEYDQLQELFRGNQATIPEPGRMTPLYLRSRTDGSVQPYALWLPKDYSPSQTYPLVVQLHGLNFHEVLSGSRTHYRGMGGPQWIQPDLPVIYAQCFGRPSTFYRGMGEEDVLEVMADVKRRFPVNPDHVYLMGHSMGGCGTYQIGLHFPDQFGGLTPIDAAMGPKVNRMNLQGLEPIPNWMAPQIAMHSPTKLYPNARNARVFFKNAGAGIQGTSTEFTDGIVAQGGFSAAVSFPGMPHNFGDQHPYAGFVPELIAQPIPRRPAEVRFFTTTLRYNQAYWVTIDRLTRHNADALVTASCDPREGLQVKTVNIDALTLRLQNCPAAQAGALVVDGTTVLAALPTGEVHLSKAGGTWQTGAWPGGAPAKRHGLQGPIDDAFNSRFLIVYGEGDRDLAITEMDALRNPPGPMDIHGDFMMKPAGKVTQQDIESNNLVLFGTPESNPILQRLAAALPPALMKRGADGSRSVFIQPNPENPNHYVLVWQGKFLSTADAALRHQWILPICLLPDYVWVKDGKIITGGHFDSDWKLGPN